MCGAVRWWWRWWWWWWYREESLKCSAYKYKIAVMERFDVCFFMRTCLILFIGKKSVIYSVHLIAKKLTFLMNTFDHTCVFSLERAYTFHKFNMCCSWLINYLLKLYVSTSESAKIIINYVHNTNKMERYVMYIQTYILHIYAIAYI